MPRTSLPRQYPNAFPNRAHPSLPRRDQTYQTPQTKPAAMNQTAPIPRPITPRLPDQAVTRLALSRLPYPTETSLFLPGLAMPARLTSPQRADPSLAWTALPCPDIPRPKIPRPACPALPCTDSSSLSLPAQPNHELPEQNWPSLPRPFPALFRPAYPYNSMPGLPNRAMPFRTYSRRPTPAMPCLFLIGLATTGLDCRDGPLKAIPSQTKPA